MNGFVNELIRWRKVLTLSGLRSVIYDLPVYQEVTAGLWLMRRPERRAV